MSNPDSMKRPSRSGATKFSSQGVPSSLSSISPILRVANEIESENPRVAYLCRFYAFQKAHRLDENCTGHGVLEFKTLLLQRLKREKATSLPFIVKNTDASAIHTYYQHYQNHVKALDQGHKEDRAQLNKAYHTSGVLFEVLCAVNKIEKVEGISLCL